MHGQLRQMSEKMSLNRTPCLTSKSGFRQMVKVFDKRWDLPQRTYFSRKARLKLHNKCHDSIAAVIKDTQHVATATVMCSSCDKEPHKNQLCSPIQKKPLKCLTGCKCHLDEWALMDMYEFKSLCSQLEIDPDVSGQRNIACRDLLTQFFTTFMKVFHDAVCLEPLSMSFRPPCLSLSHPHTFKIGKTFPWRMSY